MKLRFKILAANIKNSFQNEVAFFANNIGNVFSTVFYTVVAVIFINALFVNVKAIAGYSKNDMLFLFLAGQLSFYIFATWTEGNRDLLHTDVKTGNLDFLLIRPVPALFYISCRKINILGILRDGLPTIILVSYIINWGALNLNPTSAIFGIMIFALGQLAWNGLSYLFTFPVFWLDEATNISKISWSLGETNNTPYEGLERKIKLTLTTIIPSFLTAAVPVSVALGKSDKYVMFTLTLLVTITFSFLKSFMWKKALNNYTSVA